jgi:hypothetical protein
VSTVDRVYDAPSDVSAEEGKVVVDGPDDVAVSLTPDAAIETSDRLLHAGLAANGQRVEAKRKATHRAERRGAPPPPE